jgi:hypothetical protein
MIDKMKKLIKRLSKRLYVKWLQWNRNGRSEKERKIADTEKICMSICRNLITNPNSKFLLAPVSGKRYIKNSDLELFVILNDRNISITNHVYHYDVKLEDRNWFRLINMYDLKVESIRMEYEQDIMSQIENSLYKIQEKVRGMETISKLIEKTTDK